MPLVPDSLVDRWYHSDSWVYKNFSYLFSNPLWDKNIPSGFSLCPYFWLSLFSFLVLRPIVFIVLVVRFIFAKLQLSHLLDKSDTWFTRLTGVEGARGFPTCVALLIVCLFGLFILCLVAASYQAVVTYYGAGMLTNLISLALLGVVSVSCLNYAHTRRRDSNRCKVEYHARIATALVLGVNAYVYPAYFFWAFVKLPLAVGAWIFSTLWTCIVWVLSCIVWVGAAAGSWLLLFVGVLVVAYIFALIFENRLLEWFGTEKQRRTEKKQERSDTDRVFDALAWFLAMDYPDPHDPYSMLTYTRARKLINSNQIPEFQLWVDNYKSTRELPRGDDVKPVVEKWLENERQRYEASRSNREKLCKNVSASLQKIFGPLGVVCHNIGAFCSMLWQTVKAFKQGACPYKKFIKVKNAND